MKKLVCGAIFAMTIAAAACDGDDSSGTASGGFDAGSSSFDGSTQTSDGSSPGDGGVATPAPDFVWYVLDETSGTTAHDSSSHHSDITNLVGVTWASGATFDGTNGGGTTMVGPGYRVPPVTITAWLTPAARADETSATGVLGPFPPNAVSADIPGAYGFGIGVNVWTDGAGGSALAAENLDGCSMAGLCAASSTQNAANNGHSCTSADVCNQGFVAGQEYFVAVTIAPAADGGTTTTASVYVNGALFDSTTAAIPSPADAVPLSIGKHNDDPDYGTKRFFDGRIRDVRVYQRELGAAEIAQLETNGPTLHAP